MKSEIHKFLTFAGSSYSLPSEFREINGVFEANQIDSDVSYPIDAHGELPSVENWWFRVRAHAVDNALERKGAIKTLWDVGSGTGVMGAILRGSDWNVACVEPMRLGASSAADFNLMSICSTLEHLHLPPRSIPNLGLFDVIEHLEDPGPILMQVRNLLADEGFLVVTVPAHQILWSKFDEHFGHYRRYSPKTMRRELENHGFEVLEIKPMFAALLPFALIRKFVSSPRNSSQALAALRYSKFINPLAYIYFKFELQFLRLMPSGFGLSLLVIARTQDHSPPK
ncbi:MAG: class I SAM-dependent methyltransferase [Actinobacteria bacterium]|nr:class I SAM-dependent methyltransferase [Actinomycetota bacterium]